MHASKARSEALDLSSAEIKPSHARSDRHQPRPDPTECHAGLVDRLSHPRVSAAEREAIIRKLFIPPPDLSQLDYGECHIRSNDELRQLLTTDELHSVLPHFKDGIQRLLDFIPDQLLRPRIRSSQEFGPDSDGNPNRFTSAQVDAWLILRECNDLIRVILPQLTSPSDRYLADYFRPHFRGVAGDPENGFRPLVQLLSDRGIKDEIKREAIGRAAHCRLDRPIFVDQPDLQAWYPFREAFVQVAEICPAPVSGQALAKFARALMKHNVEGRTIFSRFDQLASCIHRIHGNKTRRELVTHEAWRSKSTSPSLYFSVHEEWQEKLAQQLMDRFPDLEELKLAFQRSARPKRARSISEF
ncbi:MAG: hypothetical protein K1X83_00010 [Oligoflexia bacterium]|nr:hypothetical protein [Oligoflexia bacterium]